MLIRAFLLVLLLSCNVSYAGLFSDDKAREQISALRIQVEEMEARIATMEETLKSQALLELYSQVETLGLELGKLRGQIEVLSNNNELLQKRQKDFYIDLDDRLRRIEDPDASRITEYPDSPENSTAPSATESERIPDSRSEFTPPSIASSAPPFSARAPVENLVPAGAEEKRMYETAYQLFTNGDYTGAISQFGIFLEDYPVSSLAPGAAYWIGNAHYALRNFQDAIEAQRNLIAMYPDSNKAPDALLNIASSQQEMADINAAKSTLKDLIVNYPYSDAADKAKRRLASFD